MPLPMNEGIKPGKRIYPDHATRAALSVIKPNTLTELTDDFVLFNYAPLCIYGGLEFNPIKEWINNKEERGKAVCMVPCQKPLFDLGTDSIFARVLWAVEKEYWEHLKLHIGSIALLNREQKLYSTAICQELQIPDINNKESKQITVFTFGVNSNKGILAFVPGTMPKLTTYPADKEIIKHADTLLRIQSI